MQVERKRVEHLKELEKDLQREFEIQNNKLQSELKEEDLRSFDYPEPYNEEKIKQLLNDPTVKEIRVFRGTKQNIRFAKFRAKYPHLSRKEIRRIMKDKNQDKYTIDED